MVTKVLYQPDGFVPYPSEIHFNRSSSACSDLNHGYLMWHAYGLGSNKTASYSTILDSKSSAKHVYMYVYKAVRPQNVLSWILTVFPIYDGHSSDHMQHILRAGIVIYLLTEMKRRQVSSLFGVLQLPYF